MDHSYIYIITALLPLAAAMVVFQVNPYHALVIRGILGAIATLVYTVLGAPDVALTEALVGTLLAITLYAVAVRSSLVLRLGVLKTEVSETQGIANTPELVESPPLKQLVKRLHEAFHTYHLRIEIIPYFDQDKLHQALIEKEVHAICERKAMTHEGTIEADRIPTSCQPIYHTTTRLKRLYDIMNSDLLSPITQLSYSNLSEAGGIES